MGKGRANPSDYFAIYLIVLCPIAILVLALFGYGVAKIVVGSVHFSDCKLEDLVPIYLIVSGLSPVLFAGFFRRDSDDGSPCGPGTLCGIIGFLFNLSWLICGSVWVCPNYKHLVIDDFKQCTENVTTNCLKEICHKGLVTFAFATIIIDWMFMCVWICFIIFLFGKIFRRY